MANELTGLEVQQVDLVGKAANRRKWLLLKADGLPQEIVDELLKEEETAPPRHEDTKTSGTERDEEGNEAVKGDRGGESAADDTEDAPKGGDTEMADNEALVKAQSDLEALRKEQAANAEKLAKAEADKAELAKQVEAKDAIVKAQAKTARAGELATLCKSAGVDFEKLYALESKDAEAAKWVVERLQALTKQVDELVGKEAGSARHDERAAKTFEERAVELAKAEKISIKEAGAKLAEAEPKLYEEYVKREMK